jgi:hypothetical protein
LGDRGTAGKYLQIAGSTGLITIGGFTVGGSYLTKPVSKTSYNTSVANSVYIGTDGIGLGLNKFTVDDDGLMHAESGNIGGWTLGDRTLTGGSITLDSSTPYIGVGTTSYQGTGFWVGNSSGYKMSVGKSSTTQRMIWDGSSIKIYNSANQAVLQSTSTGAKIGAFLFDDTDIYGDLHDESPSTDSNIQIHTSEDGPYIALRDHKTLQGGKIVLGKDFTTDASSEPHTFSGERIELDADSAQLRYYTSSRADPDIYIGGNIYGYAGSPSGILMTSGSLYIDRYRDVPGAAISVQNRGQSAAANRSGGSFFVTDMNISYGFPSGHSAVVGVVYRGTGNTQNSYGIYGISNDEDSTSTNAYSGYFAGNNFYISNTNDGITKIVGNTQITGSLTVSGELKGARAIFNFGTAVSSGVEYYMKTVNGIQMSSNLGYVMHRPGSIVGAGARFQRISGTLTVYWACEILINNSLVYTTSAVSVNTGNYFSTYGTQARGVDTFDAGDLIQVKMKPVFPNWRYIDNVIGFFEVVFDT